ncbi:VOC family protein [Paraliomyxa miuraensis]|uniref:VOC family protein n=1 Tax=Paraliomyxa miuraensis TaxID=376150 RepID=UPI00224CF679|nr:VOC family protein [Paraliomyxa miuraensis]MCX4243845.1 VOC family protein [Paraliomyxa miuraensis]
MSERSRYEPGVFSWVDHVAHDKAKAERWYAGVFGWKIREQDTAGGPPYAMFFKDGKVVAGIGQMSDEMKAAKIPPMWNDYVTVEDVAATVARAAELGGQVAVPPMQVMDAGWLAFLVDPAGATFGLWQPGRHHGAQLVDEHGALCWNELNTPDVAKAKAFYEPLLGWRCETVPMGSFEYTTIKVGERDNGGMMAMTGPEWQGIPPHWMTYFAVDDCDAIAEKIAATGGKVCVPPHDIPPGRFSVVEDPDGGVFTIIRLSAPS